MTDDGIADTLAAIGPRLRTAREQHGATLTSVSRATGISLSTLSRIETGRRKPTLEVLLQLAKAYDVCLDELAGTAPAAATGPRTPVPQRSGNEKAVLPLTRYVGGLHAHKHVLPAIDAPPVRPRQASHDGYEWLCVLYGRLWLAPGGSPLSIPTARTTSHQAGRDPGRHVLLLSGGRTAVIQPAIHSSP
ncbi:helix-turn-helix domain-containing protein [Streptomyces yunnanensis]|uniref:Helix-turn-helix domain-containing protein n=1 Tax=Streptomyces yunnanensis TaxID=156453 RepID=A0A9X8N959_9ACTN|nr:helix-turn-helix transcriptional regulator [Streptomyces yunnanensis]SHN31665.1 Helix-turn-helix domain-containing protein [Streptomyces yunnanensis]